MRYYINPKYNKIQDYILSIPNIFEIEGREIYHLRNVIKVYTAPDGTLVNVKRYHVPTGINRLIYSCGLRKPKGQRAWEYPAVLLATGINTPEPIAYIEERRCGFLGYSYFISKQCEYGHTLYEMGNAQPQEYEPMAKALARFAADMHEKGIMHKDFTPGNILWEKTSDGKIHFSLVDINRMYFGNIGYKKGLLNLIKLWGPKEFTCLLTKEYASIRGIPEEEALSIVMTARAHFWRRYAKKHDVPFALEL